MWLVTLITSSNKSIKIIYDLLSVLTLHLAIALNFTNLKISHISFNQQINNKVRPIKNYGLEFPQFIRHLMTRHIPLLLS